MIQDHKGKTYTSKSAMCAAYNVNIATFIGRQLRGLSLKESLIPTNASIYANKLYSPSLSKRFPSIMTAYKFLNLPISYSSFTKILHTEVSNLDEVIKIANSLSRQYYDSDLLNLKHASLQKVYNIACKVLDYKYSYDLLRNLIKDGMSVDDALCYIPSQYPRKINVNGLKFDTQLSFATYASAKTGVSVGAIIDRYQKGWSPEECLGLTGRGLQIRIRQGFQPNLSLYVETTIYTGVNDFMFQVTLKETGELRYMTADQIQQYPKDYTKAPF